MFIPPSKATGILRHHFHGDYSCTIGLQFADAESAARSLDTLGDPWHIGERSPNVLVGTLDSAELDAFKARYAPKMLPCGRKGCRHKCRNAEIDNVNHSIDTSGPFEVEIPPPTAPIVAAPPVEQLFMFAPTSST